MVKIQIDVTEEISKKIDIYKAVRGIKDKKDAIIQMIIEHPLNVNKIMEDAK